MEDPPRLGWWVLLVQSSAFNNSKLRDVVITGWGGGFVGSVVCDIRWDTITPMPNSISIYGTIEDAPPDFDEMMEKASPYMEDGQYFMFMFMGDPVLFKGGAQCVVISKQTVVRVYGGLLIERAVETALGGSNG